MPEVMGTPRGGAVFKRPELQGKRMSAEEVTEMRAVFASFDADGSGKISVDELSAAMEKLGTPMPRDKVASMIREVDQDGGATGGARVKQRPSLVSFTQLESTEEVQEEEGEEEEEGATSDARFGAAARFGASARFGL